LPAIGDGAPTFRSAAAVSFRRRTHSSRTPTPIKSWQLVVWDPSRVPHPNPNPNHPAPPPKHHTEGRGWLSDVARLQHLILCDKNKNSDPTFPFARGCGRVWKRAHGHGGAAGTLGGRPTAHNKPVPADNLEPPEHHHREDSVLWMHAVLCGRLSPQTKGFVR